MVLYERVAALAKKHGCSPGQLALAWVSSQGEDVVPIPGTTKLANLDENLASLNVKLSPSELAEVTAAVPMNEVAGDRRTSAANLWPNAITPPLESWTRKTNGPPWKKKFGRIVGIVRGNGMEWICIAFFSALCCFMVASKELYGGMCSQIFRFNHEVLKSKFSRVG
ncbi:unnamed protein product [Calypogeia fissa]